MGQTFELQPDARERAPREPRGERAPRTPSLVAKIQSTDIIDEYMTELDDMRARVVEFPQRDPSEVLMEISGLSGRLSEIRALLYRDGSQRATHLRTREVDPLREDLDLQFRVWSRRIAFMEWELRLSTGAI